MPFREGMNGGMNTGCGITSGLERDGAAGLAGGGATGREGTMTGLGTITGARGATKTADENAIAIEERIMI